MFGGIWVALRLGVFLVLWGGLWNYSAEGGDL